MDIRPTSDRLRETLFDVLCAGNPSVLEATIWLDLYAGTGAVGIEALSRGAGKVIFVESSAKAASLIESNLRSLQIDNRFEVMRTEVREALQRLQNLTLEADYVFLDPPYDMQQEYASTLNLLMRSQLVSAQAVVIAEHRKKFDPGADFGDLHRYRKLEQGDAAMSLYCR
jgi:16S rRNA (guanine966-N2)-methyltransferase